MDNSPKLRPDSQSGLNRETRIQKIPHCPNESRTATVYKLLNAAMGHGLTGDGKYVQGSGVACNQTAQKIIL